MSTSASERRGRRPGAEGGPVRLEAARRADKTYARRATTEKTLISIRQTLRPVGPGGEVFSHLQTIL